MKICGARTKNIIRSIGKSFNRFLSILFIVALGAGFMAGLAATSPDMFETADHYMDEYGWYDIDIKSFLGFDDSDALAVSEQDAIGTVMPMKIKDLVLMADDGDSYTCRVYAEFSDKTPELNRVNLTWGRLPSSPDECVIESFSGKYSGKIPSVGEYLSVSPDNTDYDSLVEDIASARMKIVGTVESPMCISIEGETTNVGSGSVALNVYTVSDYFTFERYTDLMIAVKGAEELSTFSDEYDELIDEAVDKLRDLAEERSAKYADELRSDIESQRDDLISLSDVLFEVNKSVGESSAAAKDEVFSLYETANDPGLGLGISTMLREIAGDIERRKAPDDIPLYSDVLDSLADADEALELLHDAVWMIRTRDDSAGYSSYGDNVGKVAALSKIFPVFFFVVALLVALTTMTRLVEEKRAEIGTLKALGYGNGAIFTEYLGYGLAASVTGSLLGFRVGFVLFPKAISSAYGMMYFLPELITPIRREIVMWVAPVTIGSIIAATLAAAWSECVSNPAALLQPKAPPAGKRIWLEHIGFIWKRLPFIRKVTFRNLFRYMKRFLMTVIGVAGCTALLVTGFGLKDSINDIVDKQFGEIYRYELSMMITDPSEIDDDETLNAFLGNGEYVSSYVLCSQLNGKAEVGRESEPLTMVVPKTSDGFTQAVLLRERESGKEVEFPSDGVVLTEKLCEKLGIRVGDTVTIEDGDGVRGSVTVKGITENYVTSYAYMSAETYSETFNKESEPTLILATLADRGSGELSDSDITSKALLSSSVIYARTSRSLRTTFADSIKSIDGVILVLILAAGLLSIVVLYNLINVNICERSKELATLKVIGFYERETRAYIFRETNILSVIGSLVGLLVGNRLHAFVVKTVEVDQVMFGRNIYPLSYLYAVAISFVFTLLVELLMHKKIAAIDMAAAMKAND